MTKADFLKKYAHCAKEEVLERIWDAKETTRVLIPGIRSERPYRTFYTLFAKRFELRDLSPLVHLTNLSHLFCFNGHIRDLSPLVHLTNLVEFLCDSTQVSDLSPLANLTNLKKITCSDSQVSDLSPLANLTNLKGFHCISTQVRDLSPLTHLTNLKKITCSQSQVSDLSPLKNLTNLEEIQCNSTQVCDLSPLTNLGKLKILNCSKTKVTDLSPLLPLIEKGVKVKWREYDYSDSGIFIKDCHNLVSPPLEIAKKSTPSILRWFAEQKRVGTQKVNEARLLLLGQGGSGKTTLKEKLRDKKAPMPAPDETTRGINIELLPHTCGDGSNFTVHVWDFGGQNIQKYAHQFFLSDSVVYAVLSNEREQNPNFQYWLNIIELLGKDSPVFIVQNEREGHAEPLKDVAQIQERFPRTFRSVEQVNLSKADTDARFDALKLKLFHEATQLPHTRKEYLTSFIAVRKKLQTLAETDHSISFKQFKQLCREEGITDELLMQDYAHTFTFLGIALHFSDDVFLKTTVFLRPKWIIDALFQLLYHPKVEAQAGRFSEADADALWQEPEYDDMHGVLLRLMEKFHLCYSIEGTKDYIVPQRLPARTEPFIAPNDATQVVFRYKFMPSGILTQLTCRLHHRIEATSKAVNQISSSLVWCDAVQFVDKNGMGRVFVREVQSAHFLEINAFGAHKADILNQVVDVLDDIHANTKFGNLRVEKLVPCPCNACMQQRNRREEAEFFNYDYLLELLRMGETESDRCRLSKQKFPIREILKNAEVRVFKVEHIRDLIAEDQLESALRILRGQFEDSNEVILQMSRLNELLHKQRTGQIPENDYRIEKSRICSAMLDTLQALEKS